MNWRKLQREADAEADEQHYYTRQRQGRPDWGIQDPGWHAPRAPTAHPDAKPPSNHRFATAIHSTFHQSSRPPPPINIMCSPKSLISICFSLLISTLISLLFATSLFSFLFSPLALSSSSSSRSLFGGSSWSPHSTLVDKSRPSQDLWANVNYFYFFLSSPCKMGRKVTNPKITVTETSGFKEEDHSWSIVNIHLTCAVNTVLSLCAVIFVICVIVYVIQRLVRRYCKKKSERK
jgi:hypothetical protein